MNGYTGAALLAATLIGTGCVAQPVENLTYRESTVREQKNLLTGVTKTLTTTRTTTEFATLDVDSDGYLVLEELPQDAGFRDVWVEFDADGDRRITQVEYDAWYVADVAED